MASLSIKSKADNVSVKTFLKWTFNKTREILLQLCVMWPEIEKEAKLRKY